MVSASRHLVMLKVIWTVCFVWTNQMSFSLSTHTWEWLTNISLKWLNNVKQMTNVCQGLLICRHISRTIDGPAMSKWFYSFTVAGKRSLFSSGQLRDVQNLQDRGPRMETLQKSILATIHSVHKNRWSFVDAQQ